MLCSHVVFRQSARRRLSRLISTAAAEAARPRPRGRPRKTLIAAADERGDCPAVAAPGDNGLPIRRGPGRPRKAATVGETHTPTHTAVVDAQPTRARKSPRKDGEGDTHGSASNGLFKGRAKGMANGKGKAVKKSAVQRTRSPRKRLPMLASPQKPQKPQKHHDLASFLEYAEKNSLKKSTCVYRGHHYEYTVVETLKRFNFTLQKMGRANDLGIDLLGTWHLPAKPHELRVLVQCKASKPRPAFVRELEGSYAGAPTGWKDGNAMALLITRDRATQGVMEALQRSREPMGFAQITELGVMQQFMWNSAASESRLTGMTVTNMYGSDAGRLLASSSSPAGRLPGIISLLWEGKQWPTTKVSLPKTKGLLGEAQPDNRLFAYDGQPTNQNSSHG